MVGENEVMGMIVGDGFSPVYDRKQGETIAAFVTRLTKNAETLLSMHTVNTCEILIVRTLDRYTVSRTVTARRTVG